MSTSPDDYYQLISGKEARQLLGGISRTTEWRLSKAGELPSPVRVGQRRRFYVLGEIRQHIENLTVSRDGASSDEKS